MPFCNSTYLYARATRIYTLFPVHTINSLTCYIFMKPPKSGGKQPNLQSAVDELPSNPCCFYLPNVHVVKGDIQQICVHHTGSGPAPVSATTTRLLRQVPFLQWPSSISTCLLSHSHIYGNLPNASGCCWNSKLRPPVSPRVLQHFSASKLPNLPGSVSRSSDSSRNRSLDLPMSPSCRQMAFFLVNCSREEISCACLFFMAYTFKIQERREFLFWLSMRSKFSIVMQ